MSGSTEILKQMQHKKGMYGSIARLYVNDPEKSHDFLRECFQQFHCPMALEIFGEDLMQQIVEYAKQHGFQPEESIMLKSMNNQ